MNHRRKKSRIHMGQGSRNYLKRKLSNEDWRWWQNTPSSHHIIFHTRPRRRKERYFEQLVLKGGDADDMAWPLDRKPHHYYW